MSQPSVWEDPWDRGCVRNVTDWEDEMSERHEAPEPSHRDLLLRIGRLEAALEFIASMKDKTLLGHDDEFDAEKSHQLGAVKAFNQCADIAIQALKDK